jgi:hypothetical protein
VGLILGCFYFGQDHRLTDEAAVIAAVANAADWVVTGGYANVIIEIANEIDVPRYAHQILKPERCHELIELVQRASTGRVANRAGRLLVGTSYRGGSLPGPMWSAWPTSCFSTATISTIRPGSG